MRRVRNQKIRSSNPGLMFAAGIEQIISDHRSHQSSYEQPSYEQPSYEQHSYEQQESVESKSVVAQRESRGNLFSVLLRQFSY